MEAIYLQSMTDFVLERQDTSTFDTSQIDWYDLEQVKLDEIRNYARFLKQPLQLGFFVPCDENGNVLEEPYFDGENDLYYSAKKEEFEKAKERVLFKGFELYNDENTIRYNNIFIENQDFKKGLTIESLKSYCSTTSIELTDSAIKQIGLNYEK